MDHDDLDAAAACLIAAQPWLALATTSDAGEAQQSYLPFAVAGAVFGIVASRLAAHTANLLARRPAAIMLVAPSDTAGDAYARPRLSIAVAPLPHARVALLRSLPDFEAVALVPVSGRLILGFASAHDLDAAALGRALRHAVP